MVTVLGGKDYYRTLQVHPCAQPEIIKTVYRTLMLRLGKHPDHGGGVSEAQAINEAYDVLRDPEKREAYNQLYSHKIKEAAASRVQEAAADQSDPAAKNRRSNELLEKIASRLAPQYREIKDLPLSAAFDLLLEGPSPFKNRLMFVTYDHFSPEDWPRVFGLFKLVGLHRSPWVPRADAVVVVAREAEDRKGFLAESLRRSSCSSWTWGPRSLALLEEAHLHTELFLYLVPPLADLQSALTVSA